MEGALSHQIPHLSFHIICRCVRHERYSILSPYSEILATKDLSVKSYDVKYANSNVTGLARFSTSPQLGKTRHWNNLVPRPLIGFQQHL